MSNYQARIDAASPEARRLFVAHAGEIRNTIPGLYSSDFERLLKSLSALLDKVDKNKVDHPEYLTFNNGNLAEYCVQLIEGIPSSFSAGVSHFLQTTLTGLITCEERLAKAVGNYYLQVRNVKDKQVREIQKLAEESLQFRSSILNLKNEIDGLRKSGLEDTKSIAESRKLAAEDSAKLKEIRSSAEKLASGDGRGRSLEALKRTAEQKVESIQTVLAQAETAGKAVVTATVELDGSSQRFVEAEAQLKAIREKADAVLALSNQAGLAASYRQEASRLGYKSLAFTILLYAVTATTIFFAIKQILPGMSDAIEKIGPNFTPFEAMSIAILRSLLILPLLYVIYFTSRRIDSLELLRMDYAEKAAASLAYSGYSEQMNSDPALLNQLKASLIVKFNEHPERLIGRGTSKTKAEISVPGYRAATEMLFKGDKSKGDGDDGE